METFPYRIKTIRREAALTRGLLQGGKEFKTSGVRIKAYMVLNFREVGTKSNV